MTQVTNKFDLEERTTVFSEKVIDICKSCPKNNITLPIIDQLIRAGTSIGANYCKKEAKETQYWIQLLAKSLDDKEQVNSCRVLWQEAKEFGMIFSKIASNTK